MTITAPAHWDLYLVKGVKKMMDDYECRLADQHFEGLKVVEVVEGSKRFTWSYDKHGGDAQGGEVADFRVTTKI